MLLYKVQIFKKKPRFGDVTFLFKENTQVAYIDTTLHVSLALLPGLPCLVVLLNFVKTVFFQKTVSVLYFTALSAISASCAL